MSNVRLSATVLSTVIVLSAHVAFAQTTARMGPLARAASNRPDKVQVIVRLRSAAGVPVSGGSAMAER